jgi:hypothetical protein
MDDSNQMMVVFLMIVVMFGALYLIGYRYTRSSMMSG